MAAPSTENVIADIDAARKGHLSHPSLNDRSDSDVWKAITDLDDSQVASAVFLKQRKRPLIQPRGGFPTFEKQRSLTRSLAENGADFLPLTIDSHTRQNDFERAKLLLDESEATDEDLLNGYPLVAHGWRLSRRLFDDIKKPISLRHGTADARILVEQALASGITEIEGGALCYSLPYNARYPIDRAMLHWQLIDRLCSKFCTESRQIHRESFGPLTATMVPPVITIVTQLCELLLAAEQKVKSFTVSFGQTGCFEQDIALAQVLRSQAQSVLDRFGFEGVNVYLAYHQWMGPFPLDRDAADDLIAASATIAACICADKIITKTRDEAFGIPSVDSNVQSVRQVRQMFNNLPVKHPFSSPGVEEEVSHLSGMVDSVMNAIFAIRTSTFVSSVVEAVRRGIIDIPFAPHIANRNKLMCLRDDQNAIRIAHVGDVPLPKNTVIREIDLTKSRPDIDKPEYERLYRDITFLTEKRTCASM